MSDIVERLRKAANDPHTVSTTVRNGVRNWEIGCDKELLLEAADEIESLMEDLEVERMNKKMMNRHEVAWILAEVTGTNCACDVYEIDGWLPYIGAWNRRVKE